MEPTEDDFFENIRTLMQQNEVPYRDGAWENFQRRQQQKKKTLLFSIIPAAAVLVIGCLVYLWPHPDAVIRTNTENMHVNTAPVVHENTFPTLKTIKVPSARKIMHARYVPAAHEIKENTTVIPDQAPETVQPVTTVQTAVNTAKAPKPAPVKFRDTPSSQSYGTSPATVYALSDHSFSSSSSTNDIWKIGALVSSNYGNTDRIHPGLGAYVEMSISKRISLSSGIAYDQLTSKHNLNHEMIIASEEKVLESVYTNVSGIDIPLGVKYSLNNKTYLNVGVSAMAVLKQNQTRNYLDSKTVTQSYTDEEGVVRSESKLVVENVKEFVKDEEVSTKNYLGFYNLAIGRRQKINSKQFITIEPYVKVPMQAFSSEKIKLFSGGVRLKIDL